MKGLINLKVRDAESIVFEGEVDRISSFNEVGRFDVYPKHANFISIIRQELTLYKNGEKLKQMKIEQAILKVKKDVASIFLGIDTLMIDEEKAVQKKSDNI
jgi:F0F1-type ATP synthase epsilon subunit